MELFERIRYICEIKDISLAKFAGLLGFPQQTFHKWLSSKTQKHLFDHLPKVLTVFPDIRPEWLYMGQEPAFKDSTEAVESFSKDEFEALQQEVAKLKQELAEADRLNRKLTARLFVETSSDQDGQTDSGKASAGQE